ncbi:MAG: flagellar biosynthetic protein FliO [Cyanobacteriota bacterium]
MTEFIFGFTVYTLGAIGVLVLGYVAAKYLINNTGFKPNHPQKDFLKIEQGLALENRKSIYMVKAGKQRFLVATTPENVSFLAELDNDNQPKDYLERSDNTISTPQMHPDLQNKLKYINMAKNLVGQNTFKR